MVAPPQQVPGTIFVLGDADCGQLGLGEDVTEKLRPGPVQLPYGKKVRRNCCLFPPLCPTVSLVFTVNGLSACCQSATALLNTNTLATVYP
jgi:hypothetical protein